MCVCVHCSPLLCGVRHGVAGGAAHGASGGAEVARYAVLFYVAPHMFYMTANLELVLGVCVSVCTLLSLPVRCAARCALCVCVCAGASE